MTPGVTRLIVANVIMFLVQQGLDPRAESLLMFRPELTLLRPWTPITYMFLHGGIWHLFFNMLGLYFFGPALESRLGSRHFVALYFVSGLSGAALSFLTPAWILGASGAVFGVFLGFAYYWPRQRIMIWGIIPVEAWLLVAIMTAVSIFQIGGGIAHFAHLGGYVGAFLYLKTMEARSPAKQFKRKATADTGKRVFATEGSDLRRWGAIPLDGLHPINRHEVDRLLAKAKSSGVSSLTPEERATLDRFATKH
jgi:membrane associated rhomboid family serine protease